MENGLKVFEFESRQVRVVDVDGEPWWVAKDVCDVLELGTEQIRRLDDDEKGLRKMQTLGGIQSLSVISESGLYALIVRSNKPEAKRFRKWVTSEVLPSIRKTGVYVSPRGKLSPEMELAAKMRAEAWLNNSRVRVAKHVRAVVGDFWHILSPESKQVIGAYIIDMATGKPGLVPLPAVEKTWSATDLAREFGVSVQTIGRIANAAGLKNPEYGMSVLDKARGCDKQVTSFRYNNKGRERLRVLMPARGTSLFPDEE
jgi:prophage antirepressor-like protein